MQRIVSTPQSGEFYFGDILTSADMQSYRRSSMTSVTPPASLVNSHAWA
jgi:hypothetical protein